MFTLTKRFRQTRERKLQLYLHRLCGLCCDGLKDGPYYIAARGAKASTATFLKIFGTAIINWWGLRFRQQHFKFRRLNITLL